MASKPTGQIKAKLLVVLIFVIGLLAGALSINLYQRVYGAPENVKHDSNYVFDKLNKRLDLTSDQQTRIRDILKDTFSQYDSIGKDMEPRINEVRQHSRDRIRSILAKDQLPKFEEMVAESDKKRVQRNEQEHNKK
ncbi:MAG: hypothetical protein ACREDR_13870 [Blastocatellia bacterium]